MSSNKIHSLTPQAYKVLIEKGTEMPNSGQYNLSESQGTYVCRLCGLALFRSTDKFLSSCGWPSFDDEIENAVKRLPDPYGQRTEILCNRCNGHLGHVFHNEGLTSKNVRHCVNSLSIDFVNSLDVLDTEEAIFAAGCFWGPQKLFEEHEGVIKSEVGYSGGHVDYPSYEEVCRGNTGHLEVIRLVFDPQKITYEALVRDFFNMHNPEQADGQGPDRGSQYLSAVFYYDDLQKEVCESLITKLQDKGLKVATQLRPVTTFWPAEEYHQHYYQKNGKQPYCHIRTQRFD